MRYASVRFHNYRQNRIFCSGSWDDKGAFYLPFEKIRTLFLQHNIELNTPDVNRGREISFELHINVQRRAPTHRAYVFQYENAVVRPRNEDLRALQAYHKVFTWNPVLAQLLGYKPNHWPHAVVLPYPNRLEVTAVPAFKDRPYGCVMVASNKSLPVHDPRDLYPKRLEIIRAFETESPSGFFSLYGRNWNYPPARPGKIGKLWASLRKRFPPPPRHPLACWRGTIIDKDALLKRAKFAVCYENVADIPGYISEKIFDCLRCGCVPIYWGPKEITDYVPPQCFIDARALPNPNSIVDHVLALGENEHAQFQEAMNGFLRSPQAAKFSMDYFARSLVEEITGDLLQTECSSSVSSQSVQAWAEPTSRNTASRQMPAH